MAVSWFFCTYIRTPGKHVGRVCAMDNFSTQIFADGGTWSDVEVLGNYAIVKVRASDATLAMIAGTAGFTRIPNSLQLSDTLGSLSQAQLNGLHDIVLSMGYTDAEITAALGSNWRARTLRQVLTFCMGRRLELRYDPVQDTIFLDGPVKACSRIIDDVDKDVQ